MKTRTIEIPVTTVKEYAKEYANRLDIKHTQALNKIAQNFGYSKFEIMKSKADSNGYVSIIIPDRIEPFYKLISDEKALKIDRNWQDILCVASSVTRLYYKECKKKVVNPDWQMASIYILKELNDLINISSNYYKKIGILKRSTKGGTFHFIINKFLNLEDMEKRNILDNVYKFEETYGKNLPDFVIGYPLTLPQDFIKELKISVQLLNEGTIYKKVPLYNTILIDYFKKNIHELNMYDNSEEKKMYIDFLNKFN